ncbi:MAG: Uncharacterised protein [SAR116 cluster bacterium]|nr:MAG: Uncharacterised protein [SAR116 cluster bacterium]
MRVIRRTADKTFLHIKINRPVFRQPVDDTHICLHDFSADSVAGQHHDLAVRHHYFIL